MDVDERNEKLAMAQRWRHRNYWYRDRFYTRPHDPEHERRMNLWFRDARLGLFIHFAPSTVPGRGGNVWTAEERPFQEVLEVARDWRIREDAAEHWARLAVRGGMKYAILTAQHGAGFFLWDTDTDEHNSVDMGPGRDIVAEYVEACRRHGLKVGIYYPTGEHHSEDMHAARRDGDGEAAARFRRRVHAQIEELLTRYGPIDLFWHDYPALSVEQLRAEELHAKMREWQPDMVINDRTGLPGDFSTQDYGESLIHGVKIGEAGRDWEVDLPITRSWTWIPEAENDIWSLRDLLALLHLCCCYQGNLALNVGPEADGTVTLPAQKRIEELGDWVRRHAGVVYGHGERPAKVLPDGSVTKNRVQGTKSKMGRWVVKSDTVAYYWLRWWPGSEFTLGQMRRQVAGATLVTTGEPVEFTQEGTRLTLRGMPEASPDKPARVNVIRLDLEPEDAP
jgi:alpha-L-fucosidase